MQLTEREGNMPRYYRALFEFLSQSADELSIREGELLLEKEPYSSDEYWKVLRSKEGRQGLVPINFCEVVDESKIPADYFDNWELENLKHILIEFHSILEPYVTPLQQWKQKGDELKSFLPANEWVALFSGVHLEIAAHEQLSQRSKRYLLPWINASKAELTHAREPFCLAQLFYPFVPTMRQRCVMDCTLQPSLLEERCRVYFAPNSGIDPVICALAHGGCRLGRFHLLFLELCKHCPKAHADYRTLQVVLSLLADFLAHARHIHRSRSCRAGCTWVAPRLRALARCVAFCRTFLWNDNALSALPYPALVSLLGSIFSYQLSELQSSSSPDQVCLTPGRQSVHTSATLPLEALPPQACEIEFILSNASSSSILMPTVNSNITGLQKSVEEYESRCLNHPKLLWCLYG